MTPLLRVSIAAIANHLDALLKGGNLVFLVKGAFVHDDPRIRQAWADHLAEQGAEKMQCLVTGKVAPVARLHPSLKRVRGAQSSGATLVGFNAAAYESYNRSQGQNAPVSEEATFAYTTTLNYLLSDANPNKKLYLGDTTVVYWAESDNRAYEPAFAGIIDPAYVEEEETDQTGRKKAEAALRSTAEKVKRAQALDLDAMMADLGDENPRFYILGLAPNAARVSVRFFITDPFEKIVNHIMAHYRDLAIVKEYDDQPDYLTVSRILDETVSKKSRDKDAAPLLAGAVFRAILTGAPYPAALYNAMITRIRADMDDTAKGISKINYVRAAVIKAYLLRKYRHQPEHPFKEVLTVALNEQSTNRPMCWAACSPCWRRCNRRRSAMSTPASRIGTSHRPAPRRPASSRSSCGSRNITLPKPNTAMPATGVSRRSWACWMSRTTPFRRG